MPFNGATWDESSPTNNDLAAEIDDNIRDVKQAVSGRMRQEHIWPASQSATSQAGMHTFISFSGQTGAPTLAYGTATQMGALYIASSNKSLMFEDSAGSTFTIAQSGLGVLPVLYGTGTIGSIPYVTSGGSIVPLLASATNTILACNGSATAPSYKALSSIIVVTSGQANHGATISLPGGVNSNEVQGIMVAVGNSASANGTSNPDGISTICSVDANRAVTCTWRGISLGGSGTATANYLLIAVVTH